MDQYKARSTDLRLSSARCMEEQVLDCYEKGYSIMPIPANSRKVQQSQNHRYIHGPWQTVYDRFRHWQNQGVVEQILQILRLKLDEQGLIEPATWHIDATMVKAHKAAAGAGKKSGPQALGRSRGGYSSKLHVVCEGQGVPLQMLLTGGECNEITQAKLLLEQCQLQLRRGRPRIRPQLLIADKGYDSQPLRQWLYMRGVKANIAERELRQGTKRRRKGRKPTFDPPTQCDRALVW